MPRSRVCSLVVALVAGLLAVVAVPRPAWAATVTVAPVADTFVRGDRTATNYGSSMTLQVDGSPEAQSLLRFTVTGLTDAVSRARLRLYVTNGSTNGPKVWGTTSGWDEATVTWATRPAPSGSALADLGSVAAGTWIEADVTALVTGNGTYDLLLLPDSDNGADFASREAGSTRPQLVVETGTPPPPAAGEPEADAVVRSGQPATNFGAATTLEADTSPLSRSFLRFNVEDLTEPVSRARLRLYVTNGSANGPEVWAAASSWDEATVTWSNQPALGQGPVADLGSVPAGGWVDLDVTALVAGNGTYTFALVADSSDGTDFSSRQGSANHPQLVIDTGTEPPPAHQEAFAFAAIGDTGYSSSGITRFEAMRGRINTAGPDFTVHIGDIHSGDDPCPDSLYRDTWDRFNLFTDPLVYTPGDNDWTDCSDKLGRLAYLRQVFFPTDQSLGRPTMTVGRQSAAYPENARWHQGPVTFATLHTVGPRNNDGQASEFEGRNAANITWLQSTFDAARARGSLAVVLLSHANPGFPPDATSRASRDGFEEYMAALQAETQAWGRPVLYVHGDTHTPRVDQPLPGLPKFTRVEVTGPSNPRWWRVAVIPDDPDVFRITLQN